VERISPTLWELLRVSVLALPAWLLFGVPGGALVWFCNPHRQMTRYQKEELERHEEALVLYDKLAQEAKEAGFDDGEDDQLPVHNHHLLIDVPGFSGPHADNAATIGEDGGEGGGGEGESEKEDGIEDGGGEK
ncbi:MAG: hypothetical protein IIC08_07435, partial [Proteobacteria bacterium]|nr:hypothetical protein [Pseudomonadota bacterium]